jgi:N-acetylglucosaminyldiphosphoundecaprenol N-acetyl-beta-D-mannosaminyltransferase
VSVTGVHGVTEAQNDVNFARILNDSLLVTADGMPLVWIGRMQGFKSIDRVYGPDLLPAVCAAGVSRGVRHFFYGGKEGVADKLAATLSEHHAGLIVVGTYCPPFRPLTDTESAALREAIAEAHPHFVWVGLSTPKQERFMSANSAAFPPCIMIGVGAAFDIHAGLLPQAPRWMQRSGLEWLFRLLAEPRRLWRRYLINNPLFAWRIFLQLTGLRRHQLPSS